MLEYKSGRASLLPTLLSNAPTEQGTKGKCWEQHSILKAGEQSIKSKGRHFLVWKTSHVSCKYRDREGPDEDDFDDPGESRIAYSQSRT